MSFPVLSVRVAFASNPYDSSFTFTEIGPAAAAGPGGSGWVRQLQTTRGRQRLLRAQAQFDAGTLRADLDNRDRRFDPTNTAGPYYPNVQPEKFLQVGATWNSVFYPIWSGYVDDWPQDWPGFSEGAVALSATDYFKALGVFNLVRSGYAAKVLNDGATTFLRLGEASQVAGSYTRAANLANSYYPGAYQLTFTLGQPGPIVADSVTAVALSSGTTPTGSVNLNNAKTLRLSPAWTLECWIQPGTIPAGTTVPCDLWYEKWTDYNGNATADSVTVSVTGGTGATITLTRESEVRTYTVPHSQVALDDGNWHHIVLAHSLSGGSGGYTAQPIGSNGAWCDGILLPNASSGTFTQVTQPNGTPSPSVSVWVGAGPGAAPAFVGNLADIAVYPSQLTAAQVTAHLTFAKFQAQPTGSFVNEVLDVLGFPAGQRAVDTGYTTTQVDDTDESQTSGLQMLQLLESTEQGQLYMGPDGKLNFRSRYHRYVSPNTVSQATLGDGGTAYPTEVPYAMGGVGLNFDRDELYNDVLVTRRGGNQQEATNSASITAYGDRQTPGLTDLLLADDQSALYLAQWILADTAYPQFRLGQLTLDPTADPRLWPIVLGLDIGQVITVNKHNIPGGGPALSLTCRIEGISHDITPPRGWKTTWSVSLTGTLPWMILNDPTVGLLNGASRLGW